MCFLSTVPGRPRLRSPDKLLRYTERLWVSGQFLIRPRVLSIVTSWLATDGSGTVLVLVLSLVLYDHFIAKFISLLRKRTEWVFSLSSTNGVFYITTKS